MAYLFEEGTTEKKRVKSFLKSFLKYHKDNYSTDYNSEDFLNKFLDDYNLTPIIDFANNGGINSRSIKCSCNDEKCESGISFDSNEDETIHYLRYQDRYNNMHIMEVNKETAKELINQLKQI